MSGSDTILEVDALSRDFGRMTAVKSVSLSLQRQGALGIVGESGSGKTTLANMIVGRLRPTAGTITVGGIDRSAPAKSARESRVRARQIQMVFQDPYSSLDPRH
jgi:peptide/nickel transport system ATP-binding protein